MDDMVEANAMLARARRHLREFDTTHDPGEYWCYQQLWSDLKNAYGIEMPAFRGYKPTGPISPVPPPRAA